MNNESQSVNNRDMLVKQEFIKQEYARLYDRHLADIMAHKNDVGVANLFFKDDGKLIKLSPVEEYCSRESLLNLIAENNKRLLKEIENLLKK